MKPTIWACVFGEGTPPGGPIDTNLNVFRRKKTRNVSGSQRLGASVVTRIWAVVEIALGCTDWRPSSAKLRPKLRRSALEMRTKPSSKLFVSNRAEKCARTPKMQLNTFFLCHLSLQAKWGLFSKGTKRKAADCGDSCRPPHRPEDRRRSCMMEM